MRMTCRATGLDAVDGLLVGFTDRLRRATTDALVEEAVGIMAVSKDLCPVESGALQASGTVGEPTVSGQQTTVYLSYGVDEAGGAVIYALIQHENLIYRHAAGKQAKFLERALTEWAGQGLGRIFDRVEQEISR